MKMLRCIPALLVVRPGGPGSIPGQYPGQYPPGSLPASIRLDNIRLGNILRAAGTRDSGAYWSDNSWHRPPAQRTTAVAAGRPGKAIRLQGAVAHHHRRDSAQGRPESTGDRARRSSRRLVPAGSSAQGPERWQGRGSECVRAGRLSERRFQLGRRQHHDRRLGDLEESRDARRSRRSIQDLGFAAARNGRARYSDVVVHVKLQLVGVLAASRAWR